LDDAELGIHLHAALCRCADVILYRYNPCDRNADGCVGDDDCCTAYGVDGCQFGPPCTLPNVGCKLYLCAAARENSPPIVLETFRLLDELARLWGITNCGTD
jgi:hypothetical protein